MEPKLIVKKLTETKKPFWELLYSEKVALGRLFKAWCQENEYAYNPVNFLTFLAMDMRPFLMEEGIKKNRENLVKCHYCNRCIPKAETLFGYSKSGFQNHRPSCDHPPFWTCPEHNLKGCPKCGRQEEYC
jgi:hypothetical protein